MAKSIYISLLILLHKIKFLQIQIHQKGDIGFDR